MPKLSLTVSLANSATAFRVNYPFVIALFILTLCFSAVRATAAGTDYRVIKEVSIGGDGSWDYLTIDSAARRLYIARSNRVVVVDLVKDKVVTEIEGMTGVHGVAIVPELDRGFVTSGKDNTVRIFDLKTLKEMESVKVGIKPDAILYDPASKNIFAFNNGGTTSTVIDPATGKVKAEVELGGAHESGVSDGEGHVYVNLEDKSEVVMIDSKELSAKAHWSLSPGTEPTGLAIDRQHRRLFSGCHNKMMVMLDADSGKVVATVPIGGRVDFTAFDQESQNAFSSNGDGTLTVIHESNPNSFSVVQNVPTKEGSRTMALDPKTHQIWLAAATFQDPPNQTAEQNRRHKSVVPGSFKLLIVGPLAACGRELA